jgi:hypothetical protein
MQGSLRFDLYKFWNKQVRFEKTKPRSRLRSAFISISLTLLVLATRLLMLPIFCIFERCLDSNPESCRSKQVRYQLSHPSPGDEWLSCQEYYASMKRLDQFSLYPLIKHPKKNMSQPWIELSPSTKELASQLLI